VFDISPDDILQLNDIDLRELVGRLCEAELVARGLSPAAVTWGGNQTAADGGLDVRVALPLNVSIDGFIPRPVTGFQVKKPDMPRKQITTEMRPGGTIRPVIQELVTQAGAYIIVSSTGSAADSALRSRRGAMREALSGAANADHLLTDFYDRTRLAAWVRLHPGLVTWLRARVGRSLLGWQPFGPWTGAAEGVDAEYLLDDKLRLHLGGRRDNPSQSIAGALDDLRDELAQPGKIVRLVGLSGVGKTRLAQALFDVRIGARPLPPSLAVYTNLSDDPNPQPTGLASDLVAKRTRAVLVIDNCPPDLHRRLTELCGSQTSTVSVLTIEYDVQDDQPEGTQVVTLDTSSPELIEKLVQRRYQHISQVDVRTIAETSGGNARIAIALAETVNRSESIAGLSSEELFQRLFRQRQGPSDALLHAAQACSLVYSFQGEALAGEDAELPRLAFLAGQAAAETHRQVSELIRRDLVQQRGVWRAVLPHAIANRLAARALEDIPYELIKQQLVDGAPDRLAKSFSRRLSFLHDQSRAVAIVESWLSPGGLLGDVAKLNEHGRAMFVNVAPVQPEAALAALERAGAHGELATKVWHRHRSLLRSLAYDSIRFERSVHLLARSAVESADEREAKETADSFTSLFTIFLSGTHATIEQRLAAIERLLTSGEAKSRSLGLLALDNVLEAWHFSSAHQFEFGARSRDYGYQPRTEADVAHWFGSALGFIERLTKADERLEPELRKVFARNFRSLWTKTSVRSELEQLARTFAADGFWLEGWAACRETLHFDKDRLPEEAVTRLRALESDLKPASLVERVRAVVVGNRRAGLDLDDLEVDGDPMSSIERLDALARRLAVDVTVDGAVFEELLPDVLMGGTRAWSFGRGLAAASPDRPATWARILEGLERIDPAQRDFQLLMGFLAELWEQDKALAQELLDAALERPSLLAELPWLHAAVGLDPRGAERLKRALISGQTPIGTYRSLATGRVTDHLPGEALRELLLEIAGKPDGFDIALDILYMRLYSDNMAKRPHESGLLEVGRELLGLVPFRRNNQRDDHHLAGVAKACLIGEGAGAVAADVALRLRQAVANHETNAFDNTSFLAALLERQPIVVLSALFSGDEEDVWAGAEVFNHLRDHQHSAADAVSCETLISWCDGEPSKRYPIAASIITFARRAETNGPLVWSEQAIALIVKAPEPEKVLKVLVDRFTPMSWSGSRATLMEAHARLLDSLESHVPSGLLPFVNESKAELTQAVAQERQWETQHDRERDERFE